MTNKVFRELKARKATYGFETSLSIATIPAMAAVLARAPAIDPMADVSLGGGSYSGPMLFKVYTNELSLAEMMRGDFVGTEHCRPIVP